MSTRISFSGPATTSSPTLVRNVSAPSWASTRVAMNGASSTVIFIFSTGVTRWKPSGSLRSTVENSRTSASRPIGVPSWNQVPSLRITMSISPQWAGFHRWTGGNPRPGACLAAAITPSRPGLDVVSPMQQR